MSSSLISPRFDDPCLSRPQLRAWKRSLGRDSAQFTVLQGPTQYVSPWILSLLKFDYSLDNPRPLHLAFRKPALSTFVFCNPVVTLRVLEHPIEPLGITCWRILAPCFEADKIRLSELDSV